MHVCTLHSGTYPGTSWEPVRGTVSEDDDESMKQYIVKMLNHSIVNLSTILTVVSCLLILSIHDTTQHNQIIIYCLSWAMQCNDWHNVTIYVNRE